MVPAAIDTWGAAQEVARVDRVRVWAPIADRVTAVIDGVDHELQRASDGWWARRDAAIQSGSAYGFRLNGSDAIRPDPRSRWQPDGVHGLSRAVDLGAYEWQDAAWTGRPLAGSVLYELHIGTFTPEGTLDAAIHRLDHLADLGVDAVELLPVNAFDGAHNWGYDGVLWFAVDESYGGPVAYQRFVDACHQRGLAVVQDVVYNHLGPSGNYLPEFGPYLLDREASTWGAAMNLADPEVRRYIVDNAVMFLRDLHVDGLRLDAVHALHDPSPRHILRELAEEVDVLAASVRRPLYLIAESDLNDPTMVTPREAGGLGVHAQWSDDFHHAVHVALTGETSGYYADFADLDALAKVCTAGFVHDGTFSSFRGRAHGAPIDVDTFAAWRLVVSDQNHDQIGNRAAGDRLSVSLTPGQLAIAATLTLTSPFTPLLFMGEEWGATTPWQFFTAHTDPSLGRATAEGRVAEFARMGWDPTVVADPQDPATFARSKLDWSEPTGGHHAALVHVYRELIALRHRQPELTDPRLARVRTADDAAGGWFVLWRGHLAVCVNFAPEPQTVAVRGTVQFDTAALLGGTPASATAGGVVVPGHSAVIVSEEAVAIHPEV